ncbi:MAG: LPS assembly lipoprotein LptE [Desulfovermiculus sp.]|nr:LPS assembly lipoprotein LptE [Desulfovermiculus sp.]
MNKAFVLLVSTAILFIFLALASCGYRLTSSVPIDMPQGITTLYIDRVENPSTEPWLESRLISEVRDEFSRRGQISWVNKEQADGLMHLIITQYRDYTKVERANEETLKSEVALSLEAKILSAQNMEVLWVSAPVHVRESFTGISEKSRAEERVVRDAADILANQLSSEF